MNGENDTSRKPVFAKSSLSTGVRRKVSTSSNQEIIRFSDWKRDSEIHLGIPGGAGAIISTPNDLTKFIQALLDGKIVSKESLEQMKPKDKYGLGISSYPFGGKTFYGHSGGMFFSRKKTD